MECVYVNVLLCVADSFPGADDTTLFTKFERQHKGHSHYHSPQRKLDDPVFTILHYAGEVVYHIRVSCRAIHYYIVTDSIYHSHNTLLIMSLGIIIH